MALGDVLADAIKRPKIGGKLSRVALPLTTLAPRVRCPPAGGKACTHSKERLGDTVLLGSRAVQGRTGECGREWGGRQDISSVERVRA